MTIDKVNIEQAADGGWFWTRKSGRNGEPLSRSSETYTDRSHTVQMAVKLNPGCEYTLDNRKFYPTPESVVPPTEDNPRDAQ